MKVLFFVFLTWNCYAQSDSLWLGAISLRLDRLEKFIGFDCETEPEYNWHGPFDSYEGYVNYVAQYTMATNTITFNPSYEMIQFSLEDIDSNRFIWTKWARLIDIIDHEVGHFIADRVSEKYFGKDFPNLSDSLPYEVRRGNNVVSEGIGRYFENIKWPGPFLYGPESLPAEAMDIQWLDPLYPYRGGHWIVKPIIDDFKLDGLKYLISHPLTYSDCNLRLGSILYRRKAIIYLQLNRCKSYSEKFRTIQRHWP